MNRFAIITVGLLTATAAFAQSTPPARPSQGTGTPTGSSNPAVSTQGNAPSTTSMSGKAELVSADKLEKGANSFTEAQVRSRLEGIGATNISDLKKDGDGIWRGKATHNGKSVSVGVDYKGNISAT